MLLHTVCILRMHDTQAQVRDTTALLGTPLPADEAGVACADAGARGKVRVGCEVGLAGVAGAAAHEQRASPGAAARSMRWPAYSGRDVASAYHWPRRSHRRAGSQPSHSPPERRGGGLLQPWRRAARAHAAHPPKAPRQPSSASPCAPPPPSPTPAPVKVVEGSSTSTMVARCLASEIARLAERPAA